VQTAVGSLALTVVLAVAFMVLGLGWLVALAVAAWAGMAGPMALISWLAARRRAAFLAQMPQTVDLIARSLQAGHPVSTAMSVAAQQMPAPIGPEFGKVLAEVSLGLDRDRALRNMLQRFPLAELQLFAASLEVTRETGGNVAEVLLKLGDSMRAKAQLRRKVDALAAEGKLSFWVISALPVIVVGALMMLQPRYYAEVAGDPLFWPMMSVPPVLLAVGAGIIWRMISIKV
jgi:tight adherence protein B